MTGRWGAAVVVAAAAAVLLVGCGVPLSDDAVPIPGASATRPTPSATPSVPTSTATVWYVNKERLVPRGIATTEPVTAGSVLDLLAQAPDPLSGLVTLNADPVGGPPLASLPTAPPTPEESESTGQTLDATQRVLLSATFSELTAEQQVLLIGQVVLTLTELDGAPVLFVDAAGAPLSVPLPDGRLRDGPVTRGDYVALT